MSERVQYQITSMLSAILKKEPPKTRLAVAEAIDDIIGQIDTLEDGGASSARIARETHRQANAMLASATTTNPQWPNVQCRKGCHHCCKMTVAITRHEAHQLIQVAKAKGLPIDAERLRRQLPYVDETWRTQPEADRACTFLGADGLCQVYEDRPLSCRKYFVVSPPELCDTESHPGGQTLVFIDAASEMLTTAAFTQAGCGFMPDMLLNALAEEVSNGK